jgi:hypothetical protein
MPCTLLCKCQNCINKNEFGDENDDDGDGMDSDEKDSDEDI